MRPKLHTTLALSAAALFPLPLLHAQGERPLLATPAIRVTAPVSGQALVTLKGNTHPMAQARYDQGAASPSLATGKITMLLKRSPAQDAALQQYMGSLQDPNSPNYRKWLTPAEFGASFGIADQDLQAVESWLQSQGFKIEAVPASRNLIQFSGTTGQVAQAFHTSIHSYLINGATHLSNATDPEIPAALAPVIAGVSPLNDFRPRPMHELRGRVEKTPATGEVHTVQSAAARPALTDTSSSTPFLALGPADAATIYDSPNSMNKNYTGSTQLTGTGVNIGTVNDSDLPVADYMNYRKLFLNETAPPNPTLVVDGVDPGTLNGGDAVEAVLDAELLAGIAPGANIYFYSSASALLQDGVYNAALRAVEDNNVALLSVSFGACEADEGAAGNAQLAALWQQAAAQGITVATSTGDNGSAACDDPNTESAATQGLAVSGFASTPYNIAVGGTDFDTLSTAFSQYVSTAAQSTSTSYGADFGSALSYIPENPWNDSISNNPPGAYTTNTATDYPLQGGGTTTSIAAGSGGVSSSAICPTGAAVDPTSGECISALTGSAIPLIGYPIPAFQQGSAFAGTPLAGSTVRSLPDISLFAASGAQHQAAWVFCSDNVTNADSTQTYTDCAPASAGAQFGYEIVGGTSASAPTFTGMLGLVIQSLGNGKRLGLANNVLYNLASTQYSSVFHDVTAGNNSVLCAAGSPNCGTNGFLTGYNAGTNYDLASGLGSVDVAKLVSAWDTAVFTPTSVSLQLNGSTNALSVQHGTAVSLAASVNPSAAAGDVSVNATNTGQGGLAVKQIIPLTSGAGTVSVNDLPGGSYSVQAYYQGDATHAPSTSSPAIPVTISPEASAPFLSLAILDIANQSAGPQPNPRTAYYGEYGFAYIQPLNANALNAGVGSHGVATGSVTLLNNGTAVTTGALNSQGVFAYPLYNLAPGSYSFTASYAGDASYNASSTTAAVPLTISKGPTIISLKAGSTSIAASGSTTVAVELDTDSTGNVPTGAITLTGNGTHFSATVVEGTQPDGAIKQTATFTVPGSALASGANTLTASYPGDGNYAGASGTTNITVTGTTSSAAGFSLAGPASGINVATPGTPATGTVTLTPTNGFNGTVNLTCKVQYSGAGASPICSIPATLAVSNNNAATVTVTVNTTAQSASLIPAQRPGGIPSRWPMLLGGGGTALCSVLLWGIPARRRGWRNLRTAAVVWLAFTSLGFIGCGGSTSSSGSNSSGTQAGSYTLIVTGTSGSTSANAQITVTVQ